MSPNSQPAPAKTLHAEILRFVRQHAVSLGELATAIYIVLIAIAAQLTGFAYILFPELGALAHDILKRPHGTWAKAPLLLIITPLLTATIGTLITRHLAYGYISVLAAVGAAMLVIRLLNSPIAPAISAGLLPLTLGVRSWWYPPSLLVGTVLLAGISLLWRRLLPAPITDHPLSDLADDTVEKAPRDYSWMPFFFIFLVLDIFLVGITGWRFLLFPPLAVIGFEMFAHSDICPWAKQPLRLPIACALSATAGALLVGWLGAGPLAAACSVAVSVIILRACNLHVPPALAVGLLPMVMPETNYAFPLSVGIGTLLLTLSFLAWRKVSWYKAIVIRSSE